VPDSSNLKNHRSRLLEALAIVLERQTLSELYTGDIAKEAGVSKRTFYEHFGNKEECFLDLYVTNSGKVLEVVRHNIAVTDPTLSITERVQYGVKAYLNVMQSQALLMKRLYIDIMSLGTEGMKARRQVAQQFAELIINIYENERKYNPALPILKDELVLGIVAGLNELILFKIEDGKADQLLDLVETSQILILGALQGLIQQQYASEKSID
jgi:AcrR family transcriptional regulator